MSALMSRLYIVLYERRVCVRCVCVSLCKVVCVKGGAKLVANYAKNHIQSARQASNVVATTV